MTDCGRCVHHRKGMNETASYQSCVTFAMDPNPLTPAYLNDQPRTTQRHDALDRLREVWIRNDAALSCGDPVANAPKKAENPTTQTSGTLWTCPICRKRWPETTRRGTVRKGCPNPACAGAMRGKNRPTITAASVVKMIMSEYRAGVAGCGVRPIAARYGVHPSTVARIVVREQREG